LIWLNAVAYAVNIEADLAINSTFIPPEAKYSIN
jgi:hypothetical protein